MSGIDFCFDFWGLLGIYDFLKISFFEGGLDLETSIGLAFTRPFMPDLTAFIFRASL